MQLMIPSLSPRGVFETLQVLNFLLENGLEHMAEDWRQAATYL